MTPQDKKEDHTQDKLQGQTDRQRKKKDRGSILPSFFLDEPGDSSDEETEDEEEDEEDVEPQLKYCRLSSDLRQLLQDDAAAAMCAHAKVKGS